MTKTEASVVRVVPHGHPEPGNLPEMVRVIHNSLNHLGFTGEPRKIPVEASSLIDNQSGKDKKNIPVSIGAEIRRHMCAP